MNFVNSSHALNGILKSLWIVLLCTPVFGQIVPDAGGIVYVKPAGTGNGSSWASATSDLQLAIYAGGVQEVWVAGGTYKPVYPYNTNFSGTVTADPESRNNSFLLKDNVKIYGGFAGVEASLSERNLNDPANRSILSGDVDGDDILNTGNSYHVIRSTSNTASAELNGFTITLGNANETNVGRNGGGGIYNSESSPTLTNLIVSGNFGKYGGGICNSASSPLITNTIISGNGGENGGGIYSSHETPVLVNVLITGNLGNNGGGVYNYSCSPLYTNITISGNAVSGSGGGMYSSTNSSAVVRNSIIYGNESGIYNSNSSPVFSYSIVQGSGGSPGGAGARVAAWNSSVGVDEGNNLDTDPLFTNAPLWNTAPFSGGNYTLMTASPAIDKGDNSANNSATDLSGNPRIQDEIIDLGGLESDEALPVTLVSFTATAQENGITLRWETTGEENNLGFIIKRLRNDAGFEPVANLAGKGTTKDLSRYTYLDTDPQPGLNYYQLFQVDIDGTTSNLGVRAVQFDKAVASVTVYPNPATEKFTVDFEPGRFQQMEFIGLNGIVLQKVKIDPKDFRTEIYVSNYANGIYVIRLSGNENRGVKVVVEESRLSH